MRLYFARHGESEANVLREFSNRGHKHGLTDKGRAQATDLGRKLSAVGIQRVLASPPLRARETADSVGDVLGVLVEEADELRVDPGPRSAGRSPQSGGSAYCVSQPNLISSSAETWP